MKQKVVKRAYKKPKMEVVTICNETLLGTTSYPGQHNPAQPGTPIGDGKQTAWEEDEDNDSRYSSWRN